MQFHNMRAPKTSTEIRKEQIAQCALTLVSRHGLKKLSIVGVAKAVGVVPSGLYRHYRNKDQMLDAVLELVDQRLRENVQAVRAESPASLERLRLLLVRHVRFVQHEVPLPRVVFSEEVFHGPRPRRQRVYRLFRDYLANIAQLIREGQDAGHIRADLPAETLSLMFLGLIQPAAILWLMSDGEFDVARHAEEGWQVFAATIQCPDGITCRHPLRVRRSAPKGKSR
jgi:AcrR family transcriptional regulator